MDSLPTVTFATLVGSVIRVLRANRRMHQGELTNHGISQSSLSRIEKGSMSLTVEDLAKIARCLGEEPGVILQHAGKVQGKLIDAGVRVVRREDVTGKELLIAPPSLTFYIEEVLRNE